MALLDQLRGLIRLQDRQDRFQARVTLRDNALELGELQAGIVVLPVLYLALDQRQIMLDARTENPHRRQQMIDHGFLFR